MACCACLSAAGKGKDAPPPGERPALRRLALEWLTADLTAWRVRLTADPPKNRSIVHARVAHWLTDPDLASVRSRTELEQLPLDERVAWVKLWTAVRELRDATAPREAAPPPRRLGHRTEYDLARRYLALAPKLYGQAGKAGEGEATFRMAIALLEGLCRDQPAVHRHHCWLGAARNNLAIKLRGVAPRRGPGATRSGRPCAS